MGLKQDKNSAINLPLSSDWKPLSECSKSSDSTASCDATANNNTAQNDTKPNQTEPSKPVTVCPKCSHKNNNTISCSHCGLQFSLWQKSMLAEQYADVNTTTLTAAKTMWLEVTKTPRSERAAQKFHKFCQQNMAISFASVCYREWLSKHKEDEEILALQKQLVQNALFMLPKRQTKEKESVSLKTVLISIFIAILLTFFITALLLNFMELS